MNLDAEQNRIIEWRFDKRDIGVVVGPPGCGKTFVGACLAIKKIAEGSADKILLTGYTNPASNEFGQKLRDILGPAADNLCVRTGNQPESTSCPLPFSLNHDVLRKKRIVVTTILSIKKIPRDIVFDDMIIDEAAITRVEHIMWPFSRGLNPNQRFHQENVWSINDLVDLIRANGVVGTVIGDPKQSRPISPTHNDYSAISWLLNRCPHDVLYETHRLPDMLAGLVDYVARYGGLKSAPEVAGRRLVVTRPPDVEFKKIIEPDNVITWVDVDGEEEQVYYGSWANKIEAEHCAQLGRQLSKSAPKKQIAFVTRYVGQEVYIRNYLESFGLNYPVKTTTAALGTQADVVIFSLVRNNPERNLGAAGRLEDLNVGISRSKEKLIIVGNYAMMADGWTDAPPFFKSSTNHARDLAKGVNRWGSVVDAPKIF